MGIDRVDGAAEDGIRVVERAAATGPLGALSGKHHHQASWTLFRSGDGRTLFRDRQERFAQFPHISRSKGRPDGKVGAAPAEVAGQRVEVEGALVDHLPEAPGALGQRLRRARRKGNHVAGFRRQRHGPDAGPHRSVLTHHAVPVRPPETEGVDADHDGISGKGLALRLHPHGTVVEVDLRIRHQEVPRRRCEGAPLHHQDDLEQRAVEGGRLHVSDVALDARDTKRNLAFVSSEGLRYGVAFDAVPDPGARRVGFDVVELQGSASGPGAGGAHQLDLSVTGRRGDVAARRQPFAAVGGAGRIDGGRLDDGVYGVAVPLGRCERLDGEDERPLGAHVAVGFRVEGVALALRADDPHEVEAAAHAAAAQKGDGPHQRLVAVAALERVDRRVQGAQARGAGRAVGHRRAHQVEVVRDPVREHREADAGDGVLGDAVQRSPVRYRRDLRAHEHPGGTVAQRVKVPTRTFDGLPGAGQQHPYLRLRLPQLVVGHAEEGTVEEQLRAVSNQSLVRTRQAPRPGELPDGSVAPAVALAHGFPDDFPLAEQAPEIVIGADPARHAVAVSHDGDCVSGSRRAHCVRPLSILPDDRACGDPLVPGLYQPAPLPANCHRSTVAPSRTGTSRLKCIVARASSFQYCLCTAAIRNPDAALRLRSFDSGEPSGPRVWGAGPKTDAVRASEVPGRSRACGEDSLARSGAFHHIRV